MVVGIDPGLYGAVGAVTLGAGWEFVDVADLPVKIVGTKLAVRGKEGARMHSDVKQLDALALEKIIRRMRPQLVVVEKVQPMPARRPGHRDDECPTCHRDRKQMPAGSAMTFGETCGAIRAVLELLHVDHVFVAPVSWKRAAGLPKRGDREQYEVKRESLALARSLWPGAPLDKSLHEGRAEALLIARFGVASQARLL